MDTSIDQIALTVHIDHYHGGIARDTRHIETRRSTEISQAIGNETAFVTFHCTTDMRTMSEDHVGTFVDTEVGEFAQIAPILTIIRLPSNRQMDFVLSVRSVPGG